MDMYVVNIAESARANGAFRRVLHTTGHLQLVVMTLQPGEDIGTEVHEHNDQVLTFVEGTVRAEVAGDTRVVGPGDVVVVVSRHDPQLHQSRRHSARLFTLDGPPDHAADTVHRPRPTPRRQSGSTPTTRRPNTQ